MSGNSSTPFPLGVFVGAPDLDNLANEATFDTATKGFESLMGAPASFMNSYIDGAQPISAWLDNSGWSAASAAASSTAQGMIPTIGLPMASIAAGSPSADQMFRNFAAGDYDGMLQGLVKTWADNGFMTQYWRPGIEMNLSDSASYGGSTSGEQADWIAAFKHIYTVLHTAASQDGVNLKVVWNPGIVNDSPAGNPTQTLYPGNQYVDVIGADVYGDLYPFGEGSSQGIYDWDKSGQVIDSANPVNDQSLQQWATDPINLEHYYDYPASDEWALDGSGGNALSLPDLIAFAKAQGKPIAIAETGAGNTADGANAVDNPTFVQWLSSTLENSGVAVDYVSIWDSNSAGTYAFSQPGDDKPQEAAAWAKYFGAQSSSTGSDTTGGATSSGDTLALQVSEDVGNSDAAFTVKVDGDQVGGDYTASALHASGDDGTVLLTGDWGSGVHDVQVSFIGTADGSTPVAGQNLYVSSMAYDGTTYAGTGGTIAAGGSDTVAVGGSTHTASGPADDLTLNLAEDAYNGNAQFVLYVDGKPISTPQQVSALHDKNASQAFSFSGNFGAGTHTIGVAFVNDAYGGSTSTDRNLYINGITLNGADVFSGLKAEYGNSVSLFTVNTTA